MKIEKLSEEIKTMDENIDKEGNIKDENKYYKAQDGIQEDLGIMPRHEIEEELEQLKELLKKHRHLEGKVVKEI